jgi:hypothetical protein
MPLGQKVHFQFARARAKKFYKSKNAKRGRFRKFGRMLVLKVGLATVWKTKVGQKAEAVLTARMRRHGVMRLHFSTIIIIQN